MHSEISIYVACLAAYNSGFLHGKWIDADQDAGDIQAEIAEMLKASPIPDAEEWAIHDFEGFEGICLSEWQGIERVAELAAFISEHGALGVGVMDHYGVDDLALARTALEEDYCGEHSSLADYVQELTEETTTIPENLSFYIDYERMARDMELSGDIFTVETGYQEVHIFWNR